MISRRGFLAGILAAGAAPYIVQGGILMPVKQIVVTPTFKLWGDGIHDDRPAIQELLNGNFAAVAAAAGAFTFAGDTLRLAPAQYFLEGCLIVPSRTDFDWSGSQVYAQMTNPLKPALEMRGGGVLRNVSFKARKMPV